ncbi:MAG: PLP-dependent aminotransferase family protein [Clostridia bacterium]|nr:PLP-dependent aminotransferase family protein [Clostridia bacterium]
MLYDFLGVNKYAPDSLYEQVYENIRTAISSGALKKGDKLPSVRGLAQDISVSRTTVETAYEQLCAEGYIESRAKSGFFVVAEQLDPPMRKVQNTPAEEKVYVKKYRYDFSGAGADPECTDIKFWRRCVKEVLDRPSVITTYGAAQGEKELRNALCDYSRRVRGVAAEPERIVVGAGTQTLLSVLLGLCGEYGFNAAMECGFFPQGEQIFRDFRYDITPLTADKNGIILNDDIKSRIIFVNSSGSIRGSAPIPINKRLQIVRYAKERDAVIVEDDYNGELRCTSKPVPALQGLCPERVVYIGSFSRLLLPGVRISYMVLPPNLANMYARRCEYYNQTSSKTEQLALAQYITCGRLERQLRKMRRHYAEKSALLYSEAVKAFPNDTITEIIETALCVRVKLKTDLPLDEIISRANDNSISLGKCREKNGMKYIYMSFAEIPRSVIHEGVQLLADICRKE